MNVDDSVMTSQRTSSEHIPPDGHRQFVKALTGRALAEAPGGNSYATVIGQFGNP
jgi:hypothetical protein